MSVSGRPRREGVSPPKVTGVDGDAKQDIGERVDHPVRVLQGRGHGCGYRLAGPVPAQPALRQTPLSYMMCPKNTAFINSLLVPYQNALKLVLSVNSTTRPLPFRLTLKGTLPEMSLAFSSEI